MEYDEIVYELKEKRIGYEISQQLLAERAGITRQYLNGIENGKRKASRELLEKISSSLLYLSPEPPLEILFDYVRIRFPTTDVKWILHKILRIKIDFMYLEEWGRYGYAAKYILGDVIVMFSPDKEKGVLLELKGKGCRQFETYLLAQGRDWYDFFRKTKEAGGKLKRIDLAINDKVGMLNIPELVDKCNREECISVFRSFKDYRSGELVRSREENKTEMGNTLYIGSMKSEVYFCIYEKDYEQYVKNGTPILQADVKNRFEIRLTNERAELAVDDLIQYGDAGKTAFAIINRYVRFVDKEDGKRRNDWEMNPAWANFIAMEERKLKLTSIPEPYSIDKTYRWIGHQVMPTLKTLIILDEELQKNVVETMLQNTEINVRQKKIIEQEKADVYEKIV